jgi:hypothetical protein
MEAREVPSGFKIGSMPVSARYFTGTPAIVTVLVTCTGSWAASGIRARVKLFVAAGPFVAAGAAAREVGAASVASMARTDIEIGSIFFIMAAVSWLGGEKFVARFKLFTPFRPTVHFDAGSFE